MTPSAVAWAAPGGGLARLLDQATAGSLEVNDVKHEMA